MELQRLAQYGLIIPFSVTRLATKELKYVESGLITQI